MDSCSGGADLEIVLARARGGMRQAAPPGIPTARSFQNARTPTVELRPDFRIAQYWQLVHRSWHRAERRHQAAFIRHIARNLLRDAWQRLGAVALRTAARTAWRIPIPTIAGFPVSRDSFFSRYPHESSSFVVFYFRRSACRWRFRTLALFWALLDDKGRLRVGSSPPRRLILSWCPDRARPCISSG